MDHSKNECKTQKQATGQFGSQGQNWLNSSQGHASYDLNIKLFQHQSPNPDFTQ